MALPISCPSDRSGPDQQPLRQIQKASRASFFRFHLPRVVAATFARLHSAFLGRRVPRTLHSRLLLGHFHRRRLFRFHPHDCKYPLILRRGTTCLPRIKTKMLAKTGGGRGAGNDLVGA